MSGQKTADFDWATAIGAADKPFEIAMSRYGRAPLAFVREVLHATPDPWQAEALRALAHGHTRIAIRSAHGCGKTALAAWVMVWFANTRAPFKCICTAPTSPQLFDALWPELMGWHKRLPEPWQALWSVTSDHLTLKADPESFITARTSRPEQPEAMQGIHSANVLLVCDEASGIAEQVYESAAGSMSSAGATTLLIGNPTRATGYFWRVMNVERDRWFTLRVSGVGNPRVDQNFIEEIAERYGGRDSNAFRVRCLGEWPTADSDTFIGAELVEQAMQRDVPLDLTKPEIWGVDCARFGDDSSVLVKRRGNVVTEQPRQWRQVDTMQLAGAIKHEYDLMSSNRPALICVDAIGIGAGVADRLMEQGVPTLAVNVGEAPSTTGRYVRLRDELWGRAREWLGSRVCRLPRHERLRDDLVAPRYSFTSDGRLQIERKESMRARGLPSPDCFVAGTLVTTPGGGRPIEHLEVGDLVVTPFGATKIVASWSSVTQSLTEVCFSNGSRLRGTGKHKVFCWGRGVIRLDALNPTDRMEPLTKRRLFAWRMLSLLCTGGNGSGFRPLVDTINRAGAPVSVSAFCIAACGQIITALYQMAMSSIIVTAIGETTRSKIWNYSLAGSISAGTCVKTSPSPEGWNKTRNIWQKLALLQPNGIAPLMAWRFTGRLAGLHGKTGRLFPWCVSSAGSRLPPAGLTGRRSVRGLVTENPAVPDIGRSSRKPGNARGVVNRSWRTVIGRSPVVPDCVVTESAPPTLVYNLTLARHNAYYANDILVFNCADAFNLTFAEAGLMVSSKNDTGLYSHMPIRPFISGME